MKTCLRVPVLVVSLALSLLNPLGARAGDIDTQALVRQIEILSGRVKQLESQVQALQQRLSPAPAAAGGLSSFRDAWHSIRAGQTKDEVKKALGSPQREFMLDDKLIWYYYYANAGGGSVIFGQDARVVGSQEPPRY